MSFLHLIPSNGHRHGWLYWMTSCLAACLCMACGGGYTPTPRLIEKSLKISKSCQLDFRSETGHCMAMQEDRIVDEECQLVDEDCSERFFITKESGRSRFVLINVLRPCYSQWLVDKYTDEDSDWYEHGDYRVVEFNLGTPVESPKYYEEAVIQLLLQSHWDVLESPSGEMCYYRVESSVKNMIGGSYTLKLWDEDRELMLETNFDH